MITTFHEKYLIWPVDENQVEFLYLHSASSWVNRSLKYLKRYLAHISMHFCGSEIFCAESVLNERHRYFRSRFCDIISFLEYYGVLILFSLLCFTNINMNFVSCNLVWNHPCDFTIKPERSTSSIESQVWFQTKIMRYEVQLPLPK